MSAIKLEVQQEHYVLSIEKSMIRRDHLDSLIRTIRDKAKSFEEKQQ